MLPALLAIAYIGLISLGLGYLGERWVLRVRPQPLTALLSGLVGATAVLSWLSLRFPLCPWMHAGVAAVGLVGLVPALRTFAAGAWSSRICPPTAPRVSKPDPIHPYTHTPTPPHSKDAPAVRTRVATLGVFVVGALAAAYLAAGPPLVYDTGFYHAQALRWINEYPATPGLANLQGQLGFNSAWFVWAALWDHGPLDGRAYHAVNAAVWLLGVGLWVQGVGRLRQGRPSDMLQASLLVPLCRFQHYAASVSPELPAHVLLVYAFALVLRTWEEEGADSLKRLILVAAFLPTVKLSMAPALLLIPAALWLRQQRLGWGKTRPYLGAAFALLALVVGPFLARSVALTGYLVYPFERLDLFPFDWKVPAAEVERMRLEVRGWAIEPWAGPAAALRPLGQWLGPWLRRNVADHPAELALLALAPVLFVAALLRFPRARQWERLLLCTLPPAGVLFWFTSAPDVRFGFSWIWLAAVLPAVLLVRSDRVGARIASHPVKVTSTLPRLLTPTLLALGAIWILAGTARWAAAGPHPLASLTPLPEVPMRQHRLPDGLAVGVPAAGDQSWNAPLPNTPLLNPRLRQRGPSLRIGFRLADP